MSDRFCKCSKSGCQKNIVNAFREEMLVVANVVVRIAKIAEDRVQGINFDIVYLPIYAYSCN